MRYVIPGLFLSLFAGNVFSQCEYDKISTDQFTKNKTVVTKYLKVNYPSLGADLVQLALAKVVTETTTIYVVVVYIQYLDELICVNDNSALSILTTSDEVLDLNNYESFNCSERVGSTHTALFKFEITEEDLNLLSEKEIKALRITHTDGRIDIPVMGKIPEKEKGKRFFIDNVKCILSEQN